MKTSNIGQITMAFIINKYYIASHLKLQNCLDNKKIRGSFLHLIDNCTIGVLEKKIDFDNVFINFG